MRPCRRDIGCAAILCALILSLFPAAAFTPSHLLASRYSDVVTQYLPHQLFMRREVLSNRALPFWNPFECAGTPAFPNPLYPLFSFPHLLLLPLPPALAMNLGFILHILLAGALAYGFARRAGCSAPAALLAGLVFSLNPRSLAHVQAGLYTRSIYYCFIPLLFLAAERCLARPGMRSSALVAFSMTLALLSGEAQLLIYTVPFLLMYSLIRAAVYPGRSIPGPGEAAEAARRRGGEPEFRGRRRGIISLLAGLLLFLPLSAFYLLPARSLLPLLSRARPLGAEQFALMPSRAALLSVLNPLILGDFSPAIGLPWEATLYIGLAPLLLIAGMFLRRGTRRDLAVWGLPAAAAVALSLGELSPLHFLAGKLLPPLSMFRNPGRILYLVPFFAAMLAARGFDSLLSPDARERGGRAWLVFLCVSVMAAALILGACAAVKDTGTEALIANYRARFAAFFGEEQSRFIDEARVRAGARAWKNEVAGSCDFQAVLLAALCLILILGERGGIPRGLFGALLLAAAAADLSRSGGRLVEAHRLAEFYPPSALRDALAREKGPFRLLDMSAPFPAAFWTAFPYFESTSLSISRVDGYSPVNLASYVDYLDAMTGLTTPFPRWSLAAPVLRVPQMASLLNAEFVISEGPPPATSWKPAGVFEKVPVFRQFLGAATIPELRLYRNRDCMPRGWLAPEARLCRPETLWEDLARFSPSQEALLCTWAQPILRGEPYRPVRLQARAANRIEAELDTRLPAYLCMSEIWAPGWTAEDGGAPAEVAEINGIIRGVYLPPGKHLLRMRYMPPGLAAGGVISLVAALALGALFLKRPRRR